MITTWARTAELGLGSARSRRVVERNALVGLRGWTWMLSGFFEPVFYLLSIGVGIGELVGDLDYAGRAVSYRSFVAPGTLAAAAMTGAIMDATYNVFSRLKYDHTYDAMLATPVTATDIALGELTWAVIRGAVYSAMFLVVMVVMGLAESWTAVLAVPAAVLVAFAAASLGLLGTSFMRSWQDFAWITLIQMPMFVLSTTFFPLGTYERPLQIVVQCTPLFHGVALTRALVLGEASVELLGHVAYLLVVGAAAYLVAARRFQHLLVR